MVKNSPKNTIDPDLVKNTRKLIEIHQKYTKEINKLLAEKDQIINEIKKDMEKAKLSQARKKINN